MDKSADAFRTISEVADHLDTPAHVLRFWESRFPQIRPVKRAGGRRYYRPADISLLTGIKRLLHEDGMTIRGVQKILREQGVRHVSGLLGDHGESLQDEPLIDAMDDVVVVLKPEPVPEPVPVRPAPDFAQAMAKAKHDRQSEPADLFAESVKPADADGVAITGQSALLLTEAAETPEMATLDDEPFALTAELVGPDDTVDLAQSPDPAGLNDSLAEDGFDEDFDTGPVPTLASRVRSLPEGASVAKIGAELAAVVTRLQALRDTMSEAARIERG